MNSETAQTATEVHSLSRPVNELDHIQGAESAPVTLLMYGAYECPHCVEGNKIGSSFTTTATAHGGQEATILSLNTIFYHWNMLIVSPGYVEASQFEAGNPYGASFTSNNAQADPDEVALTAARLQGRRVAEIAAKFVGDKAEV